MPYLHLLYVFIFYFVIFKHFFSPENHKMYWLSNSLVFVSFQMILYALTVFLRYEEQSLYTRQEQLFDANAKNVIVA